MPKEVNGKLRNAAVAGICFLLSLILMQFGLRGMARIGFSSVAGASFQLLMIGSIFVLSAATFVVHVYGYIRVAEKYSVPLMKWSACVFIIGIVGLYILNFIDIAITIFGDYATAHIMDGITGIFMIPYILGGAGIGLAGFRLHDRLGTTAVILGGVGVLWGLCTLYMMAGALLIGVLLVPSSSVFSLSLIFWTPILEVLLALAGIPLLFRAARD